MRHNKKFNHLGRTASHRNAMLANMACSLIKHKRITTTVAKAKALKKYVEPLLTKSKNDTTNSRRVVFSYLQDKYAITELFKEISVKIADRPGGYTRIIKTGHRLGDNAEMCFIELVDYNENMAKDKAAKKVTRTRRSKKNAAAAPAAEAAAETPAAEATESNEDEAAQDNRQAQDGRKYDDRYHSGRRDKRIKNGKRRPMEEYPPEINLDEHPEAPQLFISVLTALHIDELRDRAREQGIPEDVILDCRKPELIARMLRLHSANGGALLVGVPLFLLIRGRVPTSAAALIMVFAMLPGFLLALYERHGQPLEVVVWQMIQCSFIQPKERPYQTNNAYSALVRQHQMEKEVNAIVQKAKARGAGKDAGKAHPRRKERDTGHHPQV